MPRATTSVATRASVFPLGERIQCPLALPLGAVAVHGNRTHAVGLELLDDAVGPALGPAEDERLSVVLDQFGRDRHPLGPIDLPEVVGDVTLRLLGRLDGNSDGSCW